MPPVELSALNNTGNCLPHVELQLRFPGFYGVMSDANWVPDEGHASILKMTLQYMLLYSDSGSNKIYLFGAWPKGWDADFALHAEGGTVVEAACEVRQLSTSCGTAGDVCLNAVYRKLQGGVLTKLVVTPPARRSDIVFAQDYCRPPVVPRLKADDKTDTAALAGVDVDWPSFLARADPVNTFDIAAPNTVPDVWLEGSFAGNGMIGAQVLICPGGICHQSLLLGSNTTEPDQSLPHQAVIPLARGDVSDIRTGDLAVTCNPTAPPPYNTCGISGRTARPRFGIGDLVLSGAGPIISGSIRTHLHNATIIATLTTAKGELSFAVYVHARRQIVVVEGLRGSGGEAGATVTWEFRPAPALPPGLFKELPGGGFTGAPPAGNYTLNPRPACTASGCRQALVASPEGRGWVTTWKQTDRSRLLVAVTSDLPRPVVLPKTIRATAEAARALAAAVELGADVLAAEHTGWWAEYYWSTTSVGSSGAFLSLPAAAAQLEQFHYIQVFKVGAENACRRFADSAYSDQPDYLDNCILLDGINGPLSVSKTKWSEAIWDMNVEGSQWASFSANMIEQARALPLRIAEQLPNMIATVPPHMRNDSAAISGGTGSLSFVADCAIKYCTFPVCANVTTVPDMACLVHSTPLPPGGRKYPKGFVFGSNYYGGLPWICHNIWLVYRHTLDEAILQSLVPLLKRATTLYLRTATHGADGKLHLPTVSAMTLCLLAHPSNTALLLADVFA